ncbi:MAG: tetratricopeptide repeat protein [Fibromonadaceae bacterium]|jgi:tetratricopeptide (TPR) repeat protein|nr:tetratricopeptide repeat protein [Fibromonadaceae bacterium]
MFKHFLTIVAFAGVFVFAQNPQSLRLKQAGELANQGRHKEALDEYKAVLSIDKSNAEAYLGAGDARLKMKDYKLALDNFQLAQKYNPKLTKAIEGEAEAYEALSQKENALARWQALAEAGTAEQKTKAVSRIGILLGTNANGQASQTPQTPQAPPLSAASSASAKSSQSANPSPAAAGKSKYTYDSPEFKAGLAAFEKKNWAESAKSWGEVLKKEPGNPGAYYYAGVCRFNLGEMDKAVINFNKSFDYPEKGYNSHYYLGRVYEQKGDKAKAISYYNKYLQLTPSADGKAEVKGRIAALNSGVAAPAVKDSTTESNQASSSSDAKSSASYACNSLESCLKMEEKRKQDSVAAYLESLKNKPLTIGPEKVAPTEYGGSFAFASLTEVGSADLQKAFNLVQKKSFQSAIDALQTTRQKFSGTPNSMAAAYNLLSLYQYLELHDKVVALGNSVLQEPVPEPYKSAVLYMLAFSQVKKEQYQVGDNSLSNVIEDQKLGPTLGQKLALKAEIAAKYKPDQGSPEILKKAIEAESDNAKKNELRLKLAELYMKLQDTPFAIQTYKDIAEDCPVNTASPCRKAIYELGNISFIAQNWPMALEYYNKAMEQNNKDPELVSWALFQIGNVFRKQNNVKEAVRYYDRLIKEHPGTYWADQAKLYKDDVIWHENNKGVLKK